MITSRQKKERLVIFQRAARSGWCNGPVGPLLFSGIRVLLVSPQSYVRVRALARLLVLAQPGAAARKPLVRLPALAQPRASGPASEQLQASGPSSAHFPCGAEQPCALVLSLGSSP